MFRARSNRAKKSKKNASRSSGFGTSSSGAAHMLDFGDKRTTDDSKRTIHTDALDISERSRRVFGAVDTVALSAAGASLDDDMSIYCAADFQLSAVEEALDGSSISVALEQFVGNTRYSDISLLIVNQKTKQQHRIHAHRVILASRSSVLCKLLKDNPSLKEIKLVDVDPHDVLLMLKVMYSDAELSDQDIATHVRSVMRMGDRFDVPCVRKAILRSVTSKLTPDIATFFYVNSFEEKALDLETYVIAHFNEVCESADFVHMPLAKLVSLLPREDLYVSEVTLFKALLNWSAQETKRAVNQYRQQKERLLKTDPEKANQMPPLPTPTVIQRRILGKLCLHVRFPVMSTEDLTSTVASTGLFDGKMMQELIKYSKIKGQLGPSARPDKIGPFSTLPRKAQLY
jgi:BTB/POZ domain/BTB And C-terminal Kelch